MQSNKAEEKIKSYRALNTIEINLINKIKDIEIEIAELYSEIGNDPNVNVDNDLLKESINHIRLATMLAVRSIARPEDPFKKLGILENTIEKELLRDKEFLEYLTENHVQLVLSETTDSFGTVTRIANAWTNTNDSHRCLTFSSTLEKILLKFEINQNLVDDFNNFIEARVNN